MENEFIKLMATQGAFALSYLLFYVLKENSKREKNYQNIVQELTKLLPIIKQDVEEIKNKINLIK
ncbi:BhlA/UviB family holin-like peptide [Clostridium perfringens]|uniref:BhlA/UviB family holin-like peptide n=1 Tax=Clostridium perfringens TaxID=1502 RepID=UPI003749D6AD